MYPMDRIQQKTCSSNRSAGKSDGSYSGLSKSSLYQGRNWKIYFFAIRCFMSHFLHKIKVLKNGFCRREIFVN